MTWTLTMLTVAFGLAFSALLGWRQERRAEGAWRRQPRPAARLDAEEGRPPATRREHPGSARQIGAGAR